MSTVLLLAGGLTLVLLGAVAIDVWTRRRCQLSGHLWRPDETEEQDSFQCQRCGRWFFLQR